MTYGVTSQGFVRKSYQTILEERQKRAQQLFGDDIDLSDESPVGQYVKLAAWDLDRQWQLAEDVYYSLRMESAEGVNLDSIVDIGLQNRKKKQKAIVELTFTGVVDSSIPTGSTAETGSGRVFETISDAIIASDGKASVWARDTEAGSGGNVPAGSINKIKSPLQGIDSVTNAEPSSGGSDIETDAELKTRYEDQRYATGSSIDAIKTAIQNLSSVESVLIDENTTNDYENNLPPNSIEVIVMGGEDTSIAQVVLSKKAGGIQTVGDVLVYVTSSDGEEKPIRFSRPEYKEIYLTYTLIINDQWKDYSIQQIKRNVVALVGGYDDSGTRYGGLGLGSRIQGWEFIAIQKDIKGLSDIKYAFGLSPDSLGTESISFLKSELPVIAMENIEVLFA